MKASTILQVVGLCFMFAMYLVVMHFFIVTYMQPSQTAMLDVNFYGEANFEFIMLLIATPIVLYTFIYHLLALYKKMGEEPTKEESK